MLRDLIIRSGEPFAQRGAQFLDFAGGCIQRAADHQENPALAQAVHFRGEGCRSFLAENDSIHCREEMGSCGVHDVFTHDEVLNRSRPKGLMAALIERLRDSHRLQKLESMATKIKVTIRLEMAMIGRCPATKTTTGASN